MLHNGGTYKYVPAKKYVTICSDADALISLHLPQQRMCRMSHATRMQPMYGTYIHLTLAPTRSMLYYSAAAHTVGALTLPLPSPPSAADLHADVTLSIQSMTRTVPSRVCFSLQTLPAARHLDRSR